LHKHTEDCFFTASTKPRGILARFHKPALLSSPSISISLSLAFTLSLSLSLFRVSSCCNFDKIVSSRHSSIIFASRPLQACVTRDFTAHPDRQSPILTRPHLAEDRALPATTARRDLPHLRLARWALTDQLSVLGRPASAQRAQLVSTVPCLHRLDQAATAQLATTAQEGKLSLPPACPPGNMSCVLCRKPV